MLLADDCDVARDRVVTELRSIPGVRIVAEAADARSATDAIVDHRPDLVILDLRMPGGGGLKVVESIGEVQPRPVLIVFSNTPNPAHRERYTAHGVRYFLDKAFDLRRLRQLVRHCASGIGGGVPTSSVRADVSIQA